MNIPRINTTQNLEKREKLKSKRKRAYEIRKQRILNDPLAEYASWIVKVICEHMKITVDEICGDVKIEEFVEARFYAVKIISDNTYFADYSQIFVGKDRTTFYNTMEKIEQFLQKQRNKEFFETLKSKCTISEFNRLTIK